MCLVTLGAFLDFLDDFSFLGSESLLHELLLAVQLIGGYFLGIILVGVGLSLWVPAIVRYQREVDARLDVERRLHASEQHLALHVQSTPIGVIEWDTGFHISDWNPAAQRIFGYAKEEVLGKSVTLLLPASEISNAERIIALLRTRKEAFNHRNLNLTKDQQPITCDWSTTRLIDGNGRHIGYASLVQDITAELQAEQQLRRERDFIHGLVDSAPGLFFLFDEAGRLQRWNRHYQSYLGYADDELPGLEITSLVDPTDHHILAQWRENILRQGSASAELHFVSKRGEHLPFLATATSIPDEGQTFFTGFAVDISEQKQAEEALRQSARQLSLRNDSLQLLNTLAEQLHSTFDLEEIADRTVNTMLGGTPSPLVAFYLLSDKGTYLKLMAAHGFDDATLQLGAHMPLENSISGLTLSSQELIVIDELAQDQRLEKSVQAALVRQGLHSIVSIPLIAHGHAYGVLNLIYPQPTVLSTLEQETLRAIGQTVALAIANSHHLSDLEHQALHDSLTDLPNRTMLHRTCQRMMQQRQRPVALLLFDLDRFKEVNDTLGHHVGDELLIQIGPRVRSALTLHKSQVFRLGGDEFAIVVDLDSTQLTPQQLARQVMSAINHPFNVESMPLEIRASIGVALYPEQGDNSHALLRCADVAMYHAKHSSSGYSVYDPQFDQHTPERLAMMVEMGPAIRNNEVILHYHPKYALERQQISGFEALIRWNHPRLGLIPPSDFIPLAEMSDIIQLLTDWVTDNALTQLRRWQDAGLDLSVAINLSTRNLLDTSYADKLEVMLRKHQVQPNRLELEITEGTLMHDPEHALQVLQRIAALGVRLAIDDFGTGYSSLSYLKRLPVNTLKIDRSFVSDMLDNPQDAIIVQSTINLAHSLGLSVVAEGVESLEILQCLKGFGCDQIQGHFLTPPLSINELDDWLATHPLDSVY